MNLNPSEMARKFSKADRGPTRNRSRHPLRWYEEAPYAVTHVAFDADQPELVSYLVLKRNEGIWRVVWADVTGSDASLADDLKRFKNELMAAGVMVEDLALRFLVAIREKDEKTLRELCVDRTEGWTEALVGQFSMELRERFRQQTGEEFALYPDPTQVRVDRTWRWWRAVPFRDVQKKLGGNILVLHFCRTGVGMEGLDRAQRARIPTDWRSTSNRPAKWAAEWQDAATFADGNGNAQSVSEEVNVPTMTIIVAIVLNLIPAEMNAFTMEILGDEQTLRYDKQADGGWKVAFDGGRETATFYVDGTKLTTMDGGKPQTVDLAGHLGTDQDTDWSKLKELNFRERASVVIERDPEGLGLVFQPGNNVERQEHRVTVRWMVTGLDDASFDNPQPLDERPVPDAHRPAEAEQADEGGSGARNSAEPVARAFMEAVRRRDFDKVGTLTDRPLHRKEFDNLSAVMNSIYRAAPERLTDFAEWHFEDPYAVARISPPPGGVDFMPSLLLKRTGDAWRILAGPFPARAETSSAEELERVRDDFRRAKDLNGEGANNENHVDTVVRQVQLPDADNGDEPKVLDLASGKLLDVPVEGEHEIIAYFEKLGQGDLAWDDALSTLRGARVHEWENGMWKLLESHRESMGCAAYRLELPKRLLVTTAEGDRYAVEVSAGADDGVVIRYYRNDAGMPPGASGDKKKVLPGSPRTAPGRCRRRTCQNQHRRPTPTTATARPRRIRSNVPRQSRRRFLTPCRMILRSPWKK